MDNLTTVTMINHNALAVATVLSSTLLSAPAIAQISQDAERANSFVDELITFIETDPVGRDVESVTLSSQPMGCISIWRVVHMHCPNLGCQRLSYLP